MSTTPDLARQGGKGANLVRLAAAGLPVPPFVIAETDAYAAFVAAAGLDAVIADALTADAAQASETIRTAFAAAPLPDDLRARLVELIAPLAGGPVAVRSSATAEDLPGFSFAGQQDTFLDVTGVDAILHQIVACWSSLWTERAITYRERNGIGHDAVALAVVVQAMVDADASGVLFTANPRTGLRDETVIDATFGLGEALVSGQVTPDTFTVETATGTLRSRDITGPTPTLTTAHVGALTALGRRIADLYGEPMDVEWARVGDELSILQARPVTSLYPVPPAPDGPPQAWVSFGSVQGMLEPITPLGQDVLRVVLCGAPRALGRRVPWRTAPYLAVAGERLWLRVDAALRTRLTARLAARMLPVADPGIAAIVARLAAEPAFAPTAAGPQPALVAGVLRFAARLAPRVRAARSHPVHARRRAERACADALAQVAQALERAATAPTPQARLAARVAAVEDAAPLLLPTILPHFAPIMVPSLRALGQLRRLACHTGLPDAEALALAALRGLPGNVTTAMDVRLAETAETIRRDATAWGWVAETPASDLAEQYLRGTLPQGAQAAIAAFLADYGMRGVAEIDLGTLRWRDDPTSVVQALKAHLARPDSGLTPREEYTAGQRDAGRSLRALMDASTPRRAAAIRNEATVLRGLFGARETPKFTLIRAFGLIRDALDASATELVAAGRIAAASDVYLLHLDELRRAFDTDWHAVVAERRAVRDAEKRRGQVPRVLVSDGRAFFDGLSGEGEFGGVGVSPGVAEGPVHVVHDPRTEQLVPGEILVCRGTDPAWTPLFLPAAGLITEVGGLMTHGSVVAREYGIPAVVAVDGATTKLVTGQRIRIDGTSGAIELLPN